MKINFRKMTANELSTFWAKYHRATRKQALALFGNMHVIGVFDARDLSAIAALALDLSLVKQGHAAYREHAKIRVRNLSPAARSLLVLPALSK